MIYFAFWFLFQWYYNNLLSDLAAPSLSFILRYTYHPKIYLAQTFHCFQCLEGKLKVAVWRWYIPTSRFSLSLPLSTYPWPNLPGLLLPDTHAHHRVILSAVPSEMSCCFLLCLSKSYLALKTHLQCFIFQHALLPEVISKHISHFYFAVLPYNFVWSLNLST